jgi:pyruvate kinase
VGKYPLKAVTMLARIATDVEPEIKFVNYPPAATSETHALSEALNTIDKILDLRCIVAFTSTGHTAKLAAAERPRAPVIALTPNLEVYHNLNLVWGVKPLLLEEEVESFEKLVEQAQTQLLKRKLVVADDKIMIIAGIPTKISGGTNLLKIHTISDD